MTTSLYSRLANDLYGISVKRVLAAISFGRVSVFSRVTQLCLLTGSVGGDFLARFDVNASCLLEKSDVVSILQQVSPTLKGLAISQCDIMTGILFPSLSELYNGTDWGANRSVNARVIRSCPRLQDLHAYRMGANALTALLSQQPDRMESLTITHYSGTMTDTFSRFNNLKHLSIQTESRPGITNRFFENMHKLEVLKLYSWADEEGVEMIEGNGQFNDAGVRILLINNSSLKKIKLFGFPLTDLSLEFITQYVSDHGLEKLELHSTSASKFSLDAVYKLAKAGFANKLRKIRTTVEGSMLVFQWEK